MALSTITLFKQDFTGTSYTNPQIQNALDLSTAILSNYCNRTFGTSEYIEYKEGKGDNYIVLGNYPITRVSDISPDLYNMIKIDVSNTVYALNYYSDDTSITFTVIGFNGVEVTNSIDYADYPTISQLVAEITALANITATNQSTYDNEQSKKIKPDNGMIIGGQSDWINVYKADYQTKWQIEDGTDNVVELNRNLSGDLYVRYTAGYTLPDDTVDPVVAGNVPLDLSNICNKLAYVLLKENTDGVQGGIFKSEKLGDYQYTRFDNTDSPTSQLLIEENKVLSRYIYKTLTY